MSATPGHRNGRQEVAMAWPANQEAGRSMDRANGRSVCADPPTSLKAYRRGAHRLIEPSETLARMRPIMADFGVTRIANLTGLDIVGIPVAQAVRPNARSNAVAQGKGLDLPAAKASALMESIETYWAEAGERVVRFASMREMQRLHECAAIERLARSPGHKFHRDLDILWIEGADVADNRPVWAPYECAHARFKPPYPPGAGCFPMSTNGLASGNNRPEAIVHGLLELIERDAASLFHLQPSRRDEARVALSTIDDPDCRGLIDRFQDSGLAVGVWEITSNIGVPAFWCHVMERESAHPILPLPAEGYGCHLDKAIALSRALTEAAQARVTMIAGAREDLGRGHYEARGDASSLALWRRHLDEPQGAIDFGWIVSSGDFASFEDDIFHLRERLADQGVRQIVAIDLGPGENAPYSVVRVIAPGLEGIVGANCLPGERAQRLREPPA